MKDLPNCYLGVMSNVLGLRVGLRLLGLGLDLGFLNMGWCICEVC